MLPAKLALVDRYNQSYQQPTAEPLPWLVTASTICTVGFGIVLVMVVGESSDNGTRSGVSVVSARAALVLLVFVTS